MKKISLLLLVNILFVAYVYARKEDKPLLVINGRYTVFSFNPQQNILMYGGYKGTINEGSLVFLEIPSGKVLKKIKLFRYSVCDFNFSKDSKILAVVGGNTSANDDLKIWDMENEKEIRYYKYWNEGWLSNFPLAITPDGKWLALPQEDNFFRVKDIQADKTLLKLNLFADRIVGDGVRFVKFLFGGKTLFLVDGKVRIIDLVSKNQGSILKELTLPDKIGIISATMSFNEKYFALGLQKGINKTPYISKRGFIYIYNTDNLQLVKIFKYNNLEPISLSFSPDGKYLAVANWYYNKEGKIPNIIIWDLKKGVIVKEIFYDVKERVILVSFSPDGKYLAGGTWNEIYIWEFSKLLQNKTKEVK